MSFTFVEYPPTTVVETKTPAPREEKVNPAYAALTTFSDIPQPHTLPRNYKAYATEGFENDTVFKCLTYITQNAGAIPPVLYTDRKKQTKIDSHPLLDKLEKPNNEQTGVEYIEGTLGYLLLAGNSYQYSIRKGKQGPPDELWTLEPPKVKPIPSKKRGITGYEYDDFDATQNPIDPANIGRLRFWNPSDALFGFSPITVAAVLIDQQKSAKLWNLAQLQNFGKPSGAWTVPTVLSPNDYSKTLEKLREIYAGYQNAGKTQLLDAGMTWQPTGMKPTDMDWLNAMKYNAGGIANIFNIAPQLIGDTSSSTYDNMDQAKAASYTEAIFPLLDKFYALLRNWLLPMYPDLKGAYLYYDKETVEVVQAIIQQKNNAKIEQATKVFLAGGCDLFTYQQIVGPLIGIKPDPNGKGIYRINTILVSSDKLSEYADQAMKTPAAPPMPVPEPVSDNLPPSNTSGGQPSNNQQQGNTNNATGGTTPPATDSNTGTPNKPNKPARATPAKPAAGQASSQTGGGKASVVPVTARDANHHESHMAGNGARLEQALSRRIKAKDDEEEHTGVMVALFLDKASAKKLALKDGEPPEDLHITLAFLGDKDEIDLDVTDLEDTLKGYASEAKPLEGNISGIARFASSESSDNKSPIVALVNITGLQKWRDGLVKHLEAAGYDVANDFEYTPHITLAYIAEDDPMPDESLPQLDLSFDRLWLAVGDDRTNFPIGDEQYPEKKRHATHRKAAGDVTHLLWECKASACAFCKENDGVIVAEGDDFPNGCSSPDDCHKFCECSAYELSVPDSVDPNSLADLSIAVIAAAYAIGKIESRHDRDVAAQHPGHDRRVHPVAGHPARGRVPAPLPLPDPGHAHPELRGHMRRKRPERRHGDLRHTAGHRPHRGLGAQYRRQSARNPDRDHLPARRPVLDLPVHRGRHLRGAHRRRARRRHLAAAPPLRLTGSSRRYRPRPGTTKPKSSATAGSTSATSGCPSIRAVCRSGRCWPNRGWRRCRPGTGWPARTPSPSPTSPMSISSKTPTRCPNGGTSPPKCGPAAAACPSSARSRRNSSTWPQATASSFCRCPPRSSTPAPASPTATSATSRSTRSAWPGTPPGAASSSRTSPPSPQTTRPYRAARPGPGKTYMNRLTTVSTKGQLVIPAEIRESLGIAPGSRIAVTLQGSRIILEPVSEKLVDETRGLFAGGPSLSARLKHQRSKEKDKW